MNDPQQTKLILLKTGINELDELLRGTAKEGGILYAPAQGLFGVIWGASGTGKSILALQLCCGFARQQNGSVIFLSQESPEVLSDRLEQFGFVVDSQDMATRVRKNTLAGICLAKDWSLHLCAIPFAEEDQADFLRNILDIAAGQSHELPCGDTCPAPILLCIDSVEAFTSKAMRLAFAVRSGIDEIAPHRTMKPYRLLRQYCARHAVNLLLVSEDDGRRHSDVSRQAETYAADIAIHLGVKTLAGKYRERFLEIVKAKNQYYRRGEHHFSIVGPQGGGWKPPHYGIVIYPSVAAQLSSLRQRAEKDSRENTHGPTRNRPRCHTLGIPDLDRKILEEIGQDPVGGAGYLVQGSTSVLVSDLSARATEIGLHFAYKNGTPTRRGRGLYISFLHRKDVLEEIKSRLAELGDRNCTDVTIEHLSPEHISQGKLLHDIHHLLCPCGQHTASQYDVAVVDNLYELGSRFPLVADVNHFLAALVELFQSLGVSSLLIDTVEVGEGRNPIEKSVAAGFVDNVFVLRHVEYQCRPHRVLSVVKLSGPATPDVIWDIVEEPASSEHNKVILRAENTFELHKRVLSGLPELATITLTAYRDERGSPFDDYLKAQKKALEQMYDKAIRVLLYGPDEYARVQEMLTSAEMRGATDCHIITLDEFWLRQLVRLGRLINLKEYFGKTSEERTSYDQGEYVTAAHDIALFQSVSDELRARSGAQGDRLHVFKDKQATQKFRTNLLNNWFALPIRNNAGILCCNRQATNEFTDAVESNDNCLAQRMREWLEGRNTSFRWADLVALKGPWSQWWSKRQANVAASPKREGEYRYPADTVFFTFCMDQMESCVSFLIELALSYMPSGTTIIDRETGDLRFGDALFEQALVNALQLLTNLIGEPDRIRLSMGRHRRSSEEPPAVFSRQWMSTLGAVRRRGDSTRSAPGAQKQGDCQQETSVENWFGGLEPFELLLGPKRQHPTPVSGTWYLGILKGSVAISAATRVIKQFTSVPNELFKLQKRLGLPSRARFYRTRQGGSENGKPRRNSKRAEQRQSGVFSLPYSDQYVKLAELQARMLGSAPASTRVTREYMTNIIDGTYPFSRMRISGYEEVAPILWGLMQEAASSPKRIKDAVLRARGRYVTLRQSRGA